MTRVAVTVEELEITWEALINSIYGSLDEATRRFFLSRYAGESNDQTKELPAASRLPTLIFTVMNCQRLHEDNSDKLKL